MADGGPLFQGTGGDSSLDQLVADQIATPGRVRSVHFSSGAGAWSPIFRGKAQLEGSKSVFKSYERLFPQGNTGDRIRDGLITRRPSVLTMVADEFNRVKGKLSGEDAIKLSQHFDLIRDLEREIVFKATEGLKCTDRPMSNPGDGAQYSDDPTWLDGMMKTIRATLSCGFTNVGVLTLGQMNSKVETLGIHSDLHMDVAHNAVPNVPERYEEMTKWYTYLASQFSKMVGYLDEVDVGGGKTLLDNTVCLWLCEMANGPHELHDISAVVAGGTDYFDSGRYIKFAETENNPRGSVDLGPAHSKLLVSVARAAGAEVDAVGMGQESEYRDALGGPLPGLT